MNSSDQIKNFILQNLSEHQKDIVKTAVKKFGLTRTMDSTDLMRYCLNLQ